MDIIFAVRC